MNYLISNDLQGETFLTLYFENIFNMLKYEL